MTMLGFRGVHPVMILFFPFALAAVFGGFWLLRRFGARLGPGGRRAYLLSFAALSVAVAVTYPVARAHGKYLLLYYVAVLAAFGALTACLGLALLALRPERTAPLAASRRRFLAGGAVATAGCLVTMAGVEAAAGDAPAVADRRIALNRHSRAAAGRPLRLSLVTDLHAGFFLPDAYLAQALAAVAAFRPDAVFFGGDLVEHELDFLDQTRAFFDGLAGLAPAYAVLGNHDCYVDPDAVAAFLHGRGVRALRGESVALDGPWGRFTLCGQRDVCEPEADFACLRGLPTASTILLAHNPQLGLMLPEDAVSWLTLSGHTHGGQMRLPVLGAAVNQADRRIGPGLNLIDGRRIVVSAGLGYSGLPVRLACPPDVTNIVVS